jgi:hypothetical protein
MIIAAGGLILLPKIGIEIPFLLPRIMWVEIAFFAFLAVIHSTLRDPEPRALARSGQGGGYVGWALSQVVSSLFGSWVTTIFFGAVIVFALGMAVGIRRRHIRAVLGGTATLLLTTAQSPATPSGTEATNGGARSPCGAAGTRLNAVRHRRSTCRTRRAAYTSRFDYGSRAPCTTLAHTSRWHTGRSALTVYASACAARNSHANAREVATTADARRQCCTDAAG